MIAHRRREFAAGNHRTFSDRIHEVDNRANYDYSGRPHHQTLPGRKSDKEEFRWIVRDGEIPEIPSPKMWEQDGSPTAQSPVHHHHQQPTSRVQAIARYRQELMGLVRDLPGPDYELSLQDLVELPKRERISLEEGKEQKKRATVTPERRISRSASMESGVFLLKMFPFSFGGPRRRKRSISRSPSGACSRVSPEKSGLEKSTMSSSGGSSKSGSGGSSKSGSCGFGKNSSSGRSSKNGSGAFGKNSTSGAKNSNCNRSRKTSGCYAFFFVHRNKARGT